jgi:hypothetical protein
MNVGLLDQFLPQALSTKQPFQFDALIAEQLSIKSRHDIKHLFNKFIFADFIHDTCELLNL